VGGIFINEWIVLGVYCKIGDMNIGNNMITASPFIVLILGRKWKMGRGTSNQTSYNVVKLKHVWSIDGEHVLYCLRDRMIGEFGELCDVLFQDSHEAAGHCFGIHCTVEPSAFDSSNGCPELINRDRDIRISTYLAAFLAIFQG
jgi:hypothetical protein